MFNAHESVRIAKNHQSTLLQASGYDALELAADTEAALIEAGVASPSDATALAASLKAVAAVSPGSDLHCILAAQYVHRMERAREAEPGADADADLAAAKDECAQAHALRYGTIGVGVLATLAEHNRTMHE